MAAGDSGIGEGERGGIKREREMRDFKRLGCGCVSESLCACGREGC